MFAAFLPGWEAGKHSDISIFIAGADRACKRIFERLRGQYGFAGDLTPGASRSVALSVADFVPESGRPPVSFAINRGEIVGLAGLEGQGQREIIRALAGLIPAPLILMAKSSISGVPAAFFWCVAAIVAASILLNRSRFGLRIFAIGGNAQSAELSGIRVLAPRLVCYILCSLAGVVAGIYLTGRIASGDPTLGQPFGLDSVTAIALGGVQLSGGVGSVVGAVLGTITLGLIANGMNLLGVSPFFHAALTGVLLLGAVSLQRRKVIGI